jgi:hypothetical protein
MLDRRYLKASLFLGLALLLAGCGSPGLVSIQVTPTAEYFGAPGLTAQFTAIGTYEQGNHPASHRDITDLLTWKSNAPADATISATGLATSGNNLGSTAITATMNGFTGLLTANATVVVCAKINSTGNGCSQ